MNSERISLIAAWWAASDPYLVGFYALLPVMVWLGRRWCAKRAIDIVVAAASKLHIAVSQPVQDGARPAAEAFCVALAIYAALHLLGLPGVAAGWVLLLVRVFLIFTIFWLIDAFAQNALAQMSQVGVKAGVIQNTWLPQFVRLLLVVLMIVVLLKIWGIDLGPALTGLGIAGAAVALAAQDLIRNLIAGVNIATEKRFSEGDWVNFGEGTDGIVEKLQLRSTVIRKFDWSVIHVPNAHLANAPLTNFSTRTARRLQWFVGVPFETDEERVDTVCARIADFVAASDHFVQIPERKHHVTRYAFEASSITLMLDCFVSRNNWHAELEARDALVTEVRKIFAEAGVSFAYPTQRITAELQRNETTETNGPP